jgi:ubiquitin-activating enzyme E1 C
VAAEFVQKRVKGVIITPYCGKIQDKDEDYYMQFGLVVCGLDSVEARRWINATLVGLVDGENPDSLKPIIDGGTEGEPYDGLVRATTNILKASKDSLR